MMRALWMYLGLIAFLAKPRLDSNDLHNYCLMIAVVCTSLDKSRWIDRKVEGWLLGELDAAKRLIQAGLVEVRTGYI